MARDGVWKKLDAALTWHPEDVNEVATGSSNSCIQVQYKFQGIASHAAGAPHKGVDALNAAALGMHALELQRESFRDEDTVRVHGMMSRGGDAVNVIADDVALQYLVRAANIPAIKDANYKVNRAMQAGAIGTGAGVEISTAPGYLPTVPLHDTEMLENAIDDVLEAVGGGSTDYGDISYVYPLLQFNTGGMSGTGHNPKYDVCCEDTAYLTTAKLFAVITYRLLKDGAKEAIKIRDTFKPKMTKEEYLEYMESMIEKIVVEMKEPPKMEKA